MFLQLKYVKSKGCNNSKRIILGFRLSNNFYRNLKELSLYIYGQKYCLQNKYLYIKLQKDRSVWCLTCIVIYSLNPRTDI
jgi:hypothetical protein